MEKSYLYSQKPDYNSTAELARLTDGDPESGCEASDEMSPSDFRDILRRLRVEYNDIKRTEGKVVCVSSIAIIISIMAYFTVLGHIWVSGW